MKTSNKLLIAAGVFLLACLVGYDFTLKTEYDKGAYKSRFYQMTALKFTNFKIINHKAGNCLGLRVEQGDNYGVWVSNNYKDMVEITQNGQTLTIKYSGKDFYNLGDYSGIIITCPVLNELTAMPALIPKISDYGYDGNIEIEGFKQTVPMTLKSNQSINFTMDYNSLSELNVSMGNNVYAPGRYYDRANNLIAVNGKPQLYIGSSNSIKVANLNMQGGSQLNLQGPVIGKPNYQLADNATITLSGSSLKLVQPK